MGCIQAADSIRKEAKEAGREAALKAARAEVGREQRKAERDRLKEEALALKEAEKAARQKAARVAKRARGRAERKAALTPQVVPVVPVVAFLSLPDDEDEELLPWE